MRFLDTVSPDRGPCQAVSEKRSLTGQAVADVQRPANVPGEHLATGDMIPETACMHSLACMVY
jgi:hypothetical protein